VTADAQVTEFDTVAGWTARAVAGCDRRVAVSCACRGSGSPATLAWLAEALQVGADTRFIDIGAGLGGPAAWLADRYQAAPVACDPMRHACAGARRLFDLQAVCADATRLPWPDGTFDAGWMLAMLDTVAWPRDPLVEARRVLSPDGRLGLLSYVATGAIPPSDVPTGNHFQTETQLLHTIGTAGLGVVDRVEGTDLPTAPSEWQHHQEEITTTLELRHGGDPRWVEAQRQQETFAALLEAGLVETVALGLRPI